MLPVLDWDEEKTLVHDRLALAHTEGHERSSAPPEEPRADRRRTTSGVVAVEDLRATVVMPSDDFDPRGTVRMPAEAPAPGPSLQARLHRTTVRATREQIFGTDSAPSWDDDDPDVHEKSHFEAIAARVVAASADRPWQDEPDASRAKHGDCFEEDVIASGARLRKVEPPADDVPAELRQKLAPMATTVFAVKRTRTGMPAAGTSMPAAGSAPMPTAPAPTAAMPATPPEAKAMVAAAPALSMIPVNLTRASTSLPLVAPTLVDELDPRLVTQRRVRIAAVVTTVLAVVVAVLVGLLSWL